MLAGSKCTSCNGFKSVDVGYISEKITFFTKTERVSQSQVKRTVNVSEYFKPIRICIDCQTFFIYDQNQINDYDLGYFFQNILIHRSIIDWKPILDIVAKIKSKPYNLTYQNMPSFWNGTFNTANSYLWIDPNRLSRNANHVDVLIKGVILENDNFLNHQDPLERQIIILLTLETIRKLKFLYPNKDSFKTLSEDSFDYNLLCNFSSQLYDWDVSDINNYEGIKSENWYWGKE